MKYIHISEKYNRNSILKNGLLASKVLLLDHLKDFKYNGYLSEDEDEILYAWLSSEKDNKFIKDMIYCKIWITPRNKMLINIENNSNNVFGNFDFKNKTNIFYWTPYLNMIYDVYEIQNLNILNKDNETKIFHVQEPNDEYYDSLYEMDNKYAHDDKELCFSKSRELDFKIIKNAYLNINKNGKINIKIR